MDQLSTLRKISFFLIFTMSFLFLPLITNGQDCTDNDDCQTAFELPAIHSDSNFVCIQGCNLFASPDTMQGCMMAITPTVWYTFISDEFARVLNIEVHSEDFESPIVSVFTALSGCESLYPIGLINGNTDCVIGMDGEAIAIGNSIQSNKRYYIAVSSLLSIGGDFELCIKTISNGSYCVLDRNLQVMARSNGGPLEGPFDPDEKVTICMNINEFTAAGNGCQWFQGMVPVFGNGWDPSSFDANGQPYNAYLNGHSLDADTNGIYGSSKWGWFNDVGYHHTNSRFVIGDFDNNGRTEMCNKAYEMGCTGANTVQGGCCGPCWDDAGDILPGGWFAYGINGTCSDEGPPIKVDWGDGNTCGGGMGPWSFCFDLVTRGTPDCLVDTTRRDLTVGYYTFADGEVGSWTGGASVCALDQPVKTTLAALCGRVHTREPEVLPAITTGNVFQYQIFDAEVIDWEWNFSPLSAIPHVVNTGDNGFMFQANVVNEGSEPITVTGSLIGHVQGSADYIIKNVTFDVNPAGVATENPSPSSFAFNVQPNPARESIQVSWHTQAAFNDASLTDANGQRIFSRVLKEEENAVRKMEISLNGVPPGIYFLNMVSEGGVFTRRIIKL